MATMTQMKQMQAIQQDFALTGDVNKMRGAMAAIGMHNEGKALEDAFWASEKGQGIKLQAETDQKLAALRPKLEEALKGETRGLQASHAGQRSQLLAQMQRAGIRGATPARHMRAFESQAGRQLAGSEFAGQMGIEGLQNQIQQASQNRQMQLLQLGLQKAGMEQGQQGPGFWGSFLPAVAAAAGTAIGGPAAGAAAGAGGKFLAGLFSPKQDTSNNIPYYLAKG